MSRLMSFVALVFCVLLASAAFAAESQSVKIQRALSAAPAWLQANATAADIVNGKLVVLRPGTNGFTCLPGHLGVVGDDPICMDGQAMLWAQAWQTHKKPTNTSPGVAYMLAGGADYSVTDPYAKKGSRVYRYPPHWMIMWPFDPKMSGLSTRYSTSGTWIMWAGTPYAHLMVMQKP